MCLADEEMVDHLLLGCKTTYSLWISVLSWFGLSCVFPKTLSDHFNAWKLMLGITKGKDLRRTSFLATLWVIWKERNSRCFDGKSSNMQSILDHIRFETATWVSTSPQFRDTPTDMIMQN